ncbi:MAG: NADPH:quinone reductase [Pseudomonadota bacterium]|nr:NADPH:quinone reductase [Pseudomonadota bacterium]
MRQAWYTQTGPAREVLRVGDVAEPVAGPGEVLLRIRASGINPSDHKQRAGFGGSTVPNGRVVPHSDGAGLVQAVGEGVDPSWKGRRVWVWNARGGAFYGFSNGPEVGTASELIALPLAYVAALPDNVDFAEGACLGAPAATAHYAVFADGNVRGQTVLVHGGAGAVGELCVQFASAGGARVIATVSSAAKARVAQRAGAHHVIDYHTEDVAARVQALCPDGVDRIVEVDFAANIEVDAAVIRQNGTIASYSSPSNRQPVLPYYQLQFKGATVRFIQGYTLPPAAQALALKEIAEAAAAGWLRPTIAGRFPLDEIAAAHELVGSGTAIGNVVLTL